MKISIFGMGYVGVVSAACLAQEGHTVIGVDVEPAKVDLVNQGLTPIIEKDVGELVKKNVAEGRLRATTDRMEAVHNSELSLICVGTPSQLNGNIDLKYVRRVCESIGAAIKAKDEFHVVVARSTMLPGSTRGVVVPTLEEYSGKKMGEGFGLCNNPEFLREGTAVYDFYNPPKTVIGESEPRSGDLAASLYQGLDAPVIRTDLDTSEMVKYTDNTWHALKIGFANEIGNICKALHIDSHKVMDIFCQDTKLNLSPYYLKPGFAFGGSCLPKDVRALTYKSRSLDLEPPILNSILPSNALQVEKGIQMVMSHDKRKIGVLGFSFKAGTDDLRESPLVELIERLIGKGYDLRLYDENVNLAKLVGANRDFILNRIPHISKLMVNSVDDILEHAEVIVVGNRTGEHIDVMGRLKAGQAVVDLVRLNTPMAAGVGYEGICW